MSCKKADDLGVRCCAVSYTIVLSVRYRDLCAGHHPLELLADPIGQLTSSLVVRYPAGNTGSHISCHS